MPARVFLVAASAALMSLPPDDDDDDDVELDGDEERGRGSKKSSTGSKQRAALMQGLVAFLRSWDPKSLANLSAEVPWPFPEGLLTSRTERSLRCSMGYPPN